VRPQNGLFLFCFEGARASGTNHELFLKVYSTKNIDMRGGIQ